MRFPLNLLSHRLAAITVLAAKPILEIYRSPIVASEKDDGSPVTQADLAADLVIRAELKAAFPDIEIVSEESFSAGMKLPDRFFLVDPLDGTKEFIKKTGEFTINIALIENGKSVAGAIYAPAIHKLFIGGEQAFHLDNVNFAEPPALESFIEIRTRKANLDHIVALASLSHRDPVTDAFLHNIKPAAIQSSGSSLKFCVVACGNADIYPRVGPTMGWDTAAAQAILNAAGGSVMTASGSPMSYTNSTLLNGPFLAIGDTSLTSTLVPIFMKTVADRHHEGNDAAEAK